MRVCVWLYQREQFISWLIVVMFDFFCFLAAEQNQIWSSSNFRCDTCIFSKHSIDHIWAPKTFHPCTRGGMSVEFDPIVFVRRPCQKNDLHNPRRLFGWLRERLSASPWINILMTVFVCFVILWSSENSPWNFFDVFSVTSRDSTKQWPTDGREAFVHLPT